MNRVYPVKNRGKARRARSIAAALLLLVLAVTVPSVQADMPPRPDMPPNGQTNSITIEEGALIKLEVRFADNWPWSSRHWQTLWTMLEWQDADGTWHPVDDGRDGQAWEGYLDSVELEPSGQVIGYKTWWVAATDLGQGPFRWRVLDADGNRSLVMSDSFALPSQEGTTQVITVSLTGN